MIHEILGQEIDDAVSALLASCEQIYLVGGVVRDHLLNIPSHDIDFVVKTNALQAAKSCADRLNGAYYALDAERGTGRALIEQDGQPVVLDFATLAPGDIQADLALRDFSINAMAVDMSNPDVLIDPLNGADDLQEGILRPCSADSFANDPIRTIRAIRFKQRLNLSLEADTEDLIRRAAPGLAVISAERKRDELFAVFESPQVKQSCRLMQAYGLWNEVFPLLGRLEKLKEVPRHAHSLSGHTLQVMNYCQQLLAHVSGAPVEVKNPFVHSAWDLLDEYITGLRDYYAHPIHPQRQYDGLLYLATLYHDLSKTEIEAQEVHGKIGYPGHAQRSAELFDGTRKHWALSRDEFQFVDRIIRNHTLPAAIRDTQDGESRKAIYRFYQRSGSAGVLIAIFHLADILATYEDGLTEERWQKARETAGALLDSWFRQLDRIIAPPVLLDGDEVMRTFQLAPGPQIGALLAAVQEEQAAGGIRDKDMALQLIAQTLKVKGGTR